jgi:hypothetical protein
MKTGKVDGAVRARVVNPHFFVQKPVSLVALRGVDMHDNCTTVTAMKTKWLASREFSAHPGRALAAVGRSGRVLVTANGKPKAIMIPTSEETYSSDLEMLDRVTLTRAVEAIRANSVVNGTDALTMEQIDAEIASVRAARRRK